MLEVWDLPFATALLAQAAPAANEVGGLEKVDWLWLVIRALHLLSAMALVGGAIYLRAVLAPGAGRESDAGEFARVLSASRQRWAALVGAAALVLIASGLYSFFKIVNAYDLSRPWYHAVFGIKFLLAMVVFFMASALGGRTTLAERFRAKATSTLSIIVWLSVAVVVLATLLRFLPRHEKVDRLADPVKPVVRLDVPQ